MSEVTDRLREGAHALSEKAGELRDRIRDRAFAIWEHEGRPHGRDQEHWHAAQTELTAEPAPEPVVEAVASPAPKPKAATAEAEQIRATLAAQGGDVRATIEALGVPRKTFYDKLKRYGIRRIDFDERA